MNSLAHYLITRSQEICLDNGCTEEEHQCASSAYIDQDMQLLDICGSDYFQGTSAPYAAIPLPWLGTQTELRRAVGEQIVEESV